MAKSDKLIERFKTIPNDFTYHELKTLLSYFGYEEHPSGKTGGSRVRFFNPNSQDKIMGHKPHGNQSVSIGFLKAVFNHLKEREVINNE